MAQFGASPEGKDGWRGQALGAIWLVLLAVIGWIATDATTARTEMSRDIVSNKQRIAVLEEGQKYARESQQRIEAILEDIRRQVVLDRRR